MHFSNRGTWRKSSQHIFVCKSTGQSHTNFGNNFCPSLFSCICSQWKVKPLMTVATILPLNFLYTRIYTHTQIPLFERKSNEIWINTLTLDENNLGAMYIPLNCIFNWSLNHKVEMYKKVSIKMIIHPRDSTIHKYKSQMKGITFQSKGMIEVTRGLYCDSDKGKSHFYTSMGTPMC